VRVFEIVLPEVIIPVNITPVSVSEVCILSCDTLGILGASTLCDIHSDAIVENLDNHAMSTIPMSRDHITIKLIFFFLCSLGVVVGLNTIAHIMSTSIFNNPKLTHHHDPMI
jgi:hypothetical protein